MKTVEGVEITGFGEQQVAEDLETYCSFSSAARDHLIAAKRGGAKVEIHRKGKGGTVRLHFHTEEELMRLYEYLLEPKGKLR